MKSGDTDFGSLGATSGAATHAHPLSSAGQALVVVGTVAGVDGIRYKSASTTVPWTATARNNSGTTSVNSDSTSASTSLAGATDSSSTLPPAIALTPLIKT